MQKIITVPLSWTCVSWHPSESWSKDVKPRLIEKGANENYLNRSVYVIRLAGKFAISYPGGDSPTIYVGEGSVGLRISSHRKWANKLTDLIGDYDFQICVATPRVKNQPDTYLDCEAAVLQRFGERFGTAPLWNKQFERRRFLHHHYSQDKLDYVIGIRRGARYHWALKPMKSSFFHDSYYRTHRYD
ncbi:hypothetical protein QT231_22320 [Halomonas sp. SpR1]|uniref:hypothetical protein n=1 Tax=Halomonas sp. SpR1 TaxID=3050462 RepID=UPI0027E4B397|nr:hypothetical protein [Halomonas sp. SpR1]MDQ7735446.1 hypothetical protein [Halomonas sp. SpR1]